jgi:hypothetical protein
MDTQFIVAWVTNVFDAKLEVAFCRLLSWGFFPPAGIVKLNFISKDCAMYSKKDCQPTMKAFLSLLSSQRRRQKSLSRNAKY